MKCRVCRDEAIIDVRRANANFCAEHFTTFCRNQVTRAIDDFDMIAPGSRVLVAVSGGKDSLAVWDLLAELGYDVDGLYVGLGIGEYSDSSGGYARRFAAARGLKLIEVDLPTEYGYDIPEGSKAARRSPCSACGTTKRHIFDSTAIDRGYDVLVTGHNLDDEAAVLFGNTLRWQVDYLARQMPVLAARDGFPRKVKPLVRLSERETAAYCIVTGIDYVVEECPMSAGNKHIGYKDALNDVELRSPGAKADFYFSFLRRAQQLFAAAAATPSDDGDGQGRGTEVGRCTRCGSPASGEVCAFCRLVERATADRPGDPRTVDSACEPTPVRLVDRPASPPEATNAPARAGDEEHR